MYPTEVNVNERNLNKLISTYSKAYEAIVEEIETATDFGVANRKRILAQIDDILADLQSETNEWIEEKIPEQYESGADDAVKQLKNVGAPVSVETGFNKIHRDAIIGLVDETAAAFAEGIAGVSRSGQLLLGRVNREAITQQLAEGIIGGKTTKAVRQQIKGQLIEDGLAALVDRGGNTWTLDRYADMLFRTKLVETRNRGLANRMVENGYDLVQVSNHGTDHAECAVWESKILSASGAMRGYPTVIDARAAGLFHPNCKHAINILTPSLADKTRAYNPDKGAYDPAGDSIRGPIKENVEENMIGPAEKHQKEFDKNIKAIAGDRWKQKVGPVKKLDRSTDKIIRDYNGDIYKLKDANRATIVIDNPFDPKELDELKKEVSKYYKIDTESSKNKLDTSDGYAMAMVNVKLPGGRIGEVQVTYKEMLTAKDNGGHDLYDIWRDPDQSKEKRENALNKMRKLYGKAYKSALDRVGT